MSSGHENLPRVLVLSSIYPQTVLAGNILLWRLFEGYPADKLMVAGPEPLPEAEVLPCRFETLAEPKTARLRRSRARMAVETLVELGAWPRLRFEPPADFEPEVVLSVMELPRYYRAAARLARKRNLPLGLIVHDIPESFNRVLGPFRGAQIRANARAYRQAARRFCVSPWMAELFETRYGAPGQTLYPSRSDGLEPRPLEETARLKNGETLTIGYAGALGYGYGNQIALLAEALRGKPFRLNVYSRGDFPVPYDKEVVSHRGGGSPAETWARVKAECDATLLPYMFSATENSELYGTHFPSKLAEYFALGMPPVVSGPRMASGVRWCRERPGSALVIDQDDPAAWLQALEELRTSPELRARLAEGALEAGRDVFDPEATRREFWRELKEMMNDE